MLSKNSAKIIDLMAPYRHQILQQLLKNKGGMDKPRYLDLSRTAAKSFCNGSQQCLIVI
jgi:hypothetical protein